MIGVTIGGGKYEELSQKARESVLRHTPLDDVRIIRDWERLNPHDPHYACLYVFDEFDCESVFFFDADVYLIDTWDVTAYEGEFAAVTDNGPIGVDAKYIGMPEELYINSGVWVASREEHKHVFDKAQEIAEDSDFKQKLSDQTCLNKPLYADQTCLNTALYDLDVDITYLPRRYNIIGFHETEYEIPDNPVVLHQAGGSTIPQLFMKQWDLYEEKLLG